MKKSSLAIVSLILAALAVTPASALSDSGKGAISQYCGSIRQTLRTIQREDSRTRIAIGAIYETISSKYIVPLNLRLISNNISQPDLVSFQSNFAASRTNFSSAFITYSQSLEALLSIDCQNQPEAFYEKLTETRALRAEVRAIVNDLAEKSSDYQSYLGSVQEEL